MGMLILLRIWNDNLAHLKNGMTPMSTCAMVTSELKSIMTQQGHSVLLKKLQGISSSGSYQFQAYFIFKWPQWTPSGELISGTRMCRRMLEAPLIFSFFVHCVQRTNPSCHPIL